MSEVNAGTLIAYLRLDRSQYDQELRAAGAKADELSSHSPNIKVKVDSATALAQLAAVAAATKRLQDAQGQERVSEASLTAAREKATVAAKALADAEAKGNVAESKMATLRRQASQSTVAVAKAEENVTKARRAQAQATIQLGAAYAKADADAKRLGNTESSLSKFAKSAKNDTSALWTAAIALGPALVPLAGVAIGAAGAFGLLGGAGILAVLGIASEMKKGTPLGQAFSQTVSVLKSNLTGLEHSAASGFLGPFNAAVTRAQAQMPGLNAQMKIYGGLVGNIAGHALGGLIGAMHTLAPTFDVIAVALDRGAAKFDVWANSSQGLGKFGASVQQWLPQVVSTLGALFQALGHVSAAIGPLGGTSLTILKALADVINSMPTPLITALATAFVALRLASMGLNVLSSIAGTISKMGPAAIATAGALIVLTVQMQRHAAAAAYNAQIQQQFNGALKDSKGAIDDNVQATVAQTVAQGNLVEQGKKVGLTAADLTNAALGNAGAMEKVSNAVHGSAGAHQFLLARVQNLASQIDAAKQQYKDYTNATTENNRALAAANPALARQAQSLGLTITALQGAKAAADKKKASDQQAQAVLALAHPEYQRAAAEMHTSADAYLEAKAAVDKQKESTAQATIQMRLANDAAGLLKQSLDALNGKSLSVAQATTSYDSALLSLNDSLKTNGKTVADNTAKGVANRQSVEQAVTAAQAQAQAVADSTKSTIKGTDAYTKSGQAILDGIARKNGDKTATDRAKDAVYQYAQQLLGLGKIKVPPTKVDADVTQAKALLKSIKDQLDGLKDKTIHVDVTQTSRTVGGTAQGGHLKASGGPINGPGTSTSDSIPAWLSNGEYVVQASAVKKYGRSFFDNANAMRLAAGGAVGSAAKAAQQRANIRFTVSTDLPKVFSSILGSVSSLSATLSKLLRDVHTAATKGVGSNGVVATIQHENAQLIGLANKRAGIANKLKSATAALAAVRGQFNSEKSTVAQASASFFNLTNADTSSQSGFLADLTNRASYTKKFAADLKTLQKKGLGKGLIQQLGEAGVDQGSSAASLLAGMSAAQIKQVNALNHTAGVSATAAGTQVATAMYGAGINAAKGLVNGLKSQLGTVTAIMKRLAAVMVSQIKHDLKIHSPSQVFHELGEFMGQGLANGMQAKHATVRNAAKSLARTTVPIVGGGAAGYGSSVTVNQTINAVQGQSPYEIATHANTGLAWRAAIA